MENKNFGTIFVNSEFKGKFNWNQFQFEKKSNKILKTQISITFFFPGKILEVCFPVLINKNLEFFIHIYSLYIFFLWRENMLLLYREDKLSWSKIFSIDTLQTKYRKPIHAGPDWEGERERARRELDRKWRGWRKRRRRWYVERGEEEVRWAVQSMRCTRQKTMSRDGGQTGGKNTWRGPKPRRCGPLVWTTLPFSPSHSMSTAYVCVYATYALRGFAECIHEYRVHRDTMSETPRLFELGMLKREISTIEYIYI